jgi:hypothetical protein
LPRLTRRFELHFAVIAGLALVFAQLGAMAHAYSHAPETRSAGSQQVSPGIHAYCNDCLNFAPLLSAAGAPVALPFSLTQGCCTAPQAPIALLVELQSLLAFRSRAPPVTP